MKRYSSKCPVEIQTSVNRLAGILEYLGVRILSEVVIQYSAESPAYERVGCFLAQPSLPRSPQNMHQEKLCTPRVPSNTEWKRNPARPGSLQRHRQHQCLHQH